MTKTKMLMLKHTGRTPVNNPEHEAEALLTEEGLVKERAEQKVDHLNFVRDHAASLPDTDDTEILRICRQNYAAAPPDPIQPGDLSRWDEWKDSMSDAISGFKSCREALHFAQANIPFDHREVMIEPWSESAKYEALLYYEFPWFADAVQDVQENPESIPETLVLRNSKIISNIVYWHLRPLLFCMTAIKNKPKFVLEIGGGYGGLARQWLKNKICEVERYAIVDMPQALFFAEAALRKEFGDGVVGYMNGKDDPGTKVVLVPTGNLTSYTKHSDVVINVGSMQEMEENWVVFYMKWLQSYDSKYFYSLNYMGQPLGLMAESRNWWAPRPSAEWRATVINSDPVFIKVTCIGRFFADVLYERTAQKIPFSNWSVLHGQGLTRTSYLEGLELLRQDYTQANSEKFFNRYVQSGTESSRLIPKELMFLALGSGVPGLVDELNKLVDRFSA